MRAIVATPLKIQQPVRIVIADEQPIFRDGLRLLIETEPGFRIVGEVGNGSDVVERVRELDPDILLLGLAGGIPLLQTLQDVGAPRTSMRIIVLTPSVDTPDVARALQLGARGVVPKDSAADVLFESIRSVAAGHYWIGGGSGSQGASRLRELQKARPRGQAVGFTRPQLENLR